MNITVLNIESVHRISVRLRDQTNEYHHFARSLSYWVSKNGQQEKLTGVDVGQLCIVKLTSYCYRAKIIKFHEQVW